MWTERRQEITNALTVYELQFNRMQLLKRPFAQVSLDVKLKVNRNKLGGVEKRTTNQDN
jgi:hypothetical protein